MKTECCLNMFNKTVVHEFCVNAASAMNSILCVAYNVNIMAATIFLLFDLMRFDFLLLRFIGQMKSNNGESFQAICDFKKRRNAFQVHTKGLTDLVWSTAELQLVFDHLKIIFPMEKLAKEIIMAKEQPDI